MEHKSEKMANLAISEGWKAQVKPTIPESKRYDEIIWDLFCVRGEETLQVVFMGNRQVEATHTYMGRSTHPPHKAAVIRVLTGKPDLKKVSKQALEKVIEVRDIPFDMDSPALDILKCVIGKDITWVRKLDGEVINSSIPRIQDTNPKYLRVLSSVTTGRRILEWQDREGFHAVGLDQIVNVA